MTAQRGFDFLSEFACVDEDGRTQRKFCLFLMASSNGQQDSQSRYSPAQYRVVRLFAVLTECAEASIVNAHT